MDLKNGIIDIEGEKITPEYTFDDFKRSRFYTNQDGILMIRLDHPIQIENHTYIITMVFIDYKIYLLSLYCIDKEIPDGREIERKSLHDQILAEQGLDSINIFPWGSVESNYEPRNNVYRIDIAYRQ